MKKLIITAMALSLMAAPAFAGGSITGGNVTGGSGGFSDTDSGQIGTNGNAINEIHISGASGQVTLNGDHSVNFGSTNSGNIGHITNISSSYIEAAESLGSGLGDLTDVSMTTFSSAAVGATSYYESGFAPNFATLGIDFDDVDDDFNFEID